MADSNKYYYLKLKDNFFDTDQMIILESMKDGYKYSNILLKLYLRSLKNNGKLMLNDTIPFNSEMLVSVARHSVGDIELAVKIFKDLGLIEVLDNGAIYLLEIQTYIGKSSTEADRKRLQRVRIEKEKKGKGHLSDKCPPEIEIELELKIDSLAKKIKKPTFQNFKKQIIETYKSKPLFQGNVKIDDTLTYLESTKIGITSNGYLYNYFSSKELTRDDAIKVWKWIYANQNKLLPIKIKKEDLC